MESASVLSSLIGQQIKNVLMPSLEHRLFIQIAAALWNQDISRILTEQFYYQSQGWQVLENTVKGRASNLLLPIPLLQKILNFIKPMGKEILTRKEYHANFLPALTFVKNKLYKFYWTAQGTIDKKKTAEELIKDERLDITKRYELACVYCLENDIRALWDKMPETLRKVFYNERDPRYIEQQDLVVFWTYDIKGEVTKLNDKIDDMVNEYTLYQYAFQCAASNWNKVATEYFLRKLNPEEREQSLLEPAQDVVNRSCLACEMFPGFSYENYAEILFFLLSQMNNEQKVGVFRKHAFDMLRCSLDWPWQGLFMEVAVLMYRFINPKTFEFLLEVILRKRMDGYKDYNYETLFSEFWEKSPMYFKRIVRENIVRESSLSKLCQLNDAVYISLVHSDETYRTSML